MDMTTSERPILLIAFGGYGDTYTLIALAQEFQSTGIPFVLMTTKDFSETVAKAGIASYQEIPVSVFSLLEELPALLSNPRALFKTMKALGDLLTPALEAYLRTVDEVVKKYRPSAIVGNAAAHLMLSQAYGYYDLPQYRLDPYIWADPKLGKLGALPMLLPDAFPSWLPIRVIAPALHRVFEYAMWLVLGRNTLKITRSILGANVKNIGYAGSRQRERMYLYGMNPELVFANDVSLPAKVHMTGYFFKQGTDNPQLLQEVKSFIEHNKAHGKAVVGVCFGTMLLRSEETTRIVVESLRELGIAGLLIAGWGELVNDPSIWQPGDDMHFVSEIDFVNVLPNLDGFIAHLGAGTAAHLTLAGVPYVGIVYLPDQRNRVLMGYKRGVSAKPISRPELSKETLKAAVQEILTPEKRNNAHALAVRVDTEGVKRAARLIIEDLQQVYSKTPVQIGV
jgi:UDP:flavonoid glycosyltransferase YjiC (YdhE family)